MNDPLVTVHHVPPPQGRVGPGYYSKIATLWPGSAPHSFSSSRGLFLQMSLPLSGRASFPRGPGFIRCVLSHCLKIWLPVMWTCVASTFLVSTEGIRVSNWEYWGHCHKATKKEHFGSIPGCYSSVLGQAIGEFCAWKLGVISPVATKSPVIGLRLG